MNYPIIKILEDRLKSHFLIFEFGSGYSTLFCARLVQSVISVEYDKEWFSTIKDKAPDNVNLIYRKVGNNGEYCKSIKEFDILYDIIIVDGRDRVNCVKQSMESLSENGVIILDDSERKKYQKAIECAKKNGFNALDLEGLKPIGSGVNRSTILYRDDNCLGI